MFILNINGKDCEVDVLRLAKLPQDLQGASSIAG